MGDRHLVLLKDDKGAIERFGGNIKGQMIGAGKLLIRIRVRRL